MSGIEQIVEPMRQGVQRYADLIKELVGPNGLSLTLFGAIAGDTFDKKRNTVTNVLVMKSVDLDVLRRLSQNGVKLGKASISAPLIMTPEYIQASLDTFSLELIEIQQRHLILFGEDYFKDLLFQEEHVRHQTERELKTLLIGMRQGLLASAGREKFITALESDIAERLIRTLRGLLWLKGKKEGMVAKEVIFQAEEIIGGPLLGVKGIMAMDKQDGWETFKILYGDIEAIGKFVDI